MQSKLTTEARFWTKVQKTDGCWLWMAGKYPEGYGSFWLDGTAVRAHRYAYELLIGPIPKGLTLDHLCRVRHCVNPADLQPVSHRENILRGEGVAATAARQAHCLHGHPYDEANIYHNPKKPTWRQCRACHRAYMRTYRAKV